MALYRTTKRKSKEISYFCQGGPFSGKNIKLAATEQTLTFSIRNCVPGYYRVIYSTKIAKWVESV